MKKIDKIKSSSRNISLTTDIIVGFPGETEGDFEETVRMVERCRFRSRVYFQVFAAARNAGLLDDRRRFS